MFVETIREARAGIAAGIDQGGLRHDPLRHPLAALSAVLAVFPGFLDEIQRATAPWTEDKLQAAVADAAARVDARLVSRMIQLNRWSIGLAALLGMAVAGGAWSGGYWWGYRTAENRLINIPSALGDALTGQDAAAWLALIRNNDLGRVNRTCGEQSGRKACSFSFWIEAVPPPGARETQ
jgi:hypothetical protein